MSSIQALLLSATCYPPVPGSEIQNFNRLFLIFFMPACAARGQPRRYAFSARSHRGGRAKCIPPAVHRTGRRGG